jgi:hypothetical protein
MFESVAHGLKPPSRQPPASGLHGLPDFIEVFGSMGKV